MALDNSCLTIQALGRSVALGELYDSRSEEIIRGRTLWDPKKIANDLTVRKLSSQTSKIETSDSLKEKANSLDISASLKMSFLGGLVEVSGSAKYLEDRISSSHQERVTFSFYCETKFESLSMNTLHTKKIDFPSVFEDQMATHVVAGIKYGARVMFIFDHKNVDSESKRDVNGNMQVLVKSVPSFQIEGEGAAKINEKQKDISKKISCTYHGDVRPKINPLTFLEATQVYKDLNETVGDTGVPLEVYLFPLEKLDSKAAKLIRDIGVNLINRIEDIFEGFQDILIRCNDLENTDNFSKLLTIKMQVDSFKRLLIQKREAFQKKMLPLIKGIRGGIVEESALYEITSELTESPFSVEKLDKWTSEKENHLIDITNNCNFLKDIQFVSSEEIDNIISDPAKAKKDMIVFMLKLPAENKQLTDMQDYSDGKEPATTHSENIDEKASQTLERIYLFKEFYNITTEKENSKIFHISEISSPASDEVTGSIYRYRMNQIISTDYVPFVPSSTPDNLKVECRDKAVMLTWNAPGGGTEDIVSYDIEYETILKGVSSGNKIIKSTEGSLTNLYIDELSHTTFYQFRCRSVVPSGVSAYCDAEKVLLLKVPPSDRNYEYDDQGRVIKEFGGTWGGISTFEYDDEGKQINAYGIC